jgi:hypothetical protein
MGIKIFNSLPLELKSVTDFKVFKRLLAAQCLLLASGVFVNKAP